MTQQDEIVELPISWSCYHIPPGGKRPVLNAVIEKIPLRIRTLQEEEAPLVARVLEGAPESPGEERGWYRVLRTDEGIAALYASFVPALFPHRSADRLERQKNEDCYLLRGELSDLSMPTIFRWSTKNATEYWSLPENIAIKRSDIGRVIDSSRDDALAQMQTVASKMRFIGGNLYVPSTGPKICDLPYIHAGPSISVIEPMWYGSKTIPADIQTIESKRLLEKANKYLCHLKIDQDSIFCADHQWHMFLTSVVDIYFTQIGIIMKEGPYRLRARPLLGLSQRRLEIFHEIGGHCMKGIWPGERDKTFFDRASAFCEMAYAENKYGLAQSYEQFQTALAGLRDVPAPRPISERIEATGLLPPLNPTQEIASFRR